MAAADPGVELHVGAAFVDLDDACCCVEDDFDGAEFFLGDFDDAVDDHLFVDVDYLFGWDRFDDFVDDRDLDYLLQDDFFVDYDVSWDLDDSFDDVFFLGGVKGGLEERDREGVEIGSNWW